MRRESLGRQVVWASPPPTGGGGEVYTRQSEGPANLHCSCRHSICQGVARCCVKCCRLIQIKTVDCVWLWTRVLGVKCFPCFQETSGLPLESCLKPWGGGGRNVLWTQRVKSRRAHAGVPQRSAEHHLGAACSVQAYAGASWSPERPESLSISTG